MADQFGAWLFADSDITHLGVIGVFIWGGLAPRLSRRYAKQLLRRPIMSLLTRDAILTADDLEHENVECPEWGGTVRVRSLTGAERDRFEASLAADKEGGKPRLENIRAAFAVASIVDENDKPIFSTSDVAKLGMKSAKPLDRIFDVGRRLSGLTDDAVKELAEDFDSAQSEPSTSA